RIQTRFGQPFDESRFLPFNRLFPVTANGGKTIEVMNRYLALQTYRHLVGGIDFYQAHTVEELIAIVSSQLPEGKKWVIQPNHPSFGHVLDEISYWETDFSKLESMVQGLQQLHELEGGIFPATVYQLAEQESDPAHCDQLRINLYRYNDI